ncbi:uncharacterized protein NEMAJ01_1483 [Nematocida major]|uniref:uncharacterized protein n=1 Tax=Nematocida major TaxID=1912982 RepID=UPI002007DD5D|nr:uncharacterized protein NEMAJ01_1483 [Nematocida major]KAH9386587.1 hypothetical protein NEMAJ01_1483 [Nematocida major]
MNCFSVDRFKEEAFDVKELLEEVYEECRHKGAGVCDVVIAELEKIKEALSYKEEELREQKVHFSGKSQIEELSNALSSIEMSPYSLEFTKIFSERDRLLKRERYTEYLASAENGSLLRDAQTPSDLVEIAEFVQLVIQEAGQDENLVEGESFLGGLASSIPEAISSAVSLVAPSGPVEGSSSGEPASAGGVPNSVIASGSVPEGRGPVLESAPGGGRVLTRSLLGRLEGYKRKLARLAKSTYKEAVQSENMEMAKKAAALCRVLGMHAYPIEHLVSTQNAPSYSAPILTELDLLKENALQEMVRHLAKVQERMENAAYLIKDLIVGNQYLHKNSVSAEAFDANEIFVLIKKLLESSFAPVLEAIEGSDDPLEYLIAVETVFSHMALLRGRLCSIVPCIKDRMQTFSVLSVPEDELLKKEAEAIHVVVNGLVKAVVSGKSVLKYRLNGEVITSLKNPIEAVFRYTAVCSKTSLRSGRLGYSSKVLDTLYKSQQGGFTALLDAVFGRKYVPYLGTAMHLNTYICIKNFYKKLCTPANSESISKALVQLNACESERSKNISTFEMSYLVEKFEELLVEAKAQETVLLLNEAFHHIEDSPIFGAVAKETLQILYTKIRERAFTRTHIQDVKNILEYIDSIHRPLKGLKTGVEKKLKNLKGLLEAVFVDASDVERIFDLVKASEEEKSIILRLRERVKA